MVYLSSTQGAFSETLKNPNGFPNATPLSPQQKPCVCVCVFFYGLPEVTPGCPQRKLEEVLLVS